MERHEASGGRPAYLSAGDRQNPVIVMLHGACMNVDMFASQIAAFKDRFHVLAIDLPGHGQSREMAFSMSAACRSVTDILDHEKVTSCHLVGQSMGGIICQLLMRDRPDLATSLTLIGSVPLTAPFYRLNSLPFLLVAGIVRFAPRALVHRLIALTAGSLPETRLYIETCLRIFDRTALTRIVSEIGGTLEPGPYPALAGGAKTSVQMICGTRDFLALGLNIYLVRRWAAWLGGDVQSISKASHNANMDQPDEVNRLIAAFLRAVPEQRNRSIAAPGEFG